MARRTHSAISLAYSATRDSPLLDHDPDHGLGAAVADQHPAVTVEGLLHPSHDLAHRGNLVDRWLLRDADIDQDLREALDAGDQLRQPASPAPHDREHLEPGQQAVAGGVVVEKDDVTALLAPQVVSLGAHLLDDVAVSDRGPDQLHVDLLEGSLQSQVAHHRRHHRASLEAAPLDQILGTEREHGITVDDLAVLARHHAAVGIAVQRDPHVTAQLPHLGRELLGIEGAAFLVDVASVGIHADREHLGAELLEDRGTHLVGGTVCAVEHHPHAAQIHVGGEGLLEEDHVAPSRIVDAPRPPEVVRSGAMALEHAGADQIFDAALELVGQLEAIVGEELDAVVLVGIVARRDHHARIAAHVHGEKGHRRRRHRPDLDHVDAHRADPRCQGVLEHVAGEPGVLSDQDPVLSPAAAAKHVGHRLPEGEGHLGGHRMDVRGPRAPIGSKQRRAVARALIPFSPGLLAWPAPQSSRRPGRRLEAIRTCTVLRPRGHTWLPSAIEASFSSPPSPADVDRSVRPPRAGSLPGCAP
jgi:hypothetical protein